MSEFFRDEFWPLVPWLDIHKATDLWNKFESELFNSNPDWLKLPEEQQNAIVIERFKKSKYVRRI